MKVQYFTFFLNPLEQKALFPSDKPKIEILKGALPNKDPLKFLSRNNSLALVKVWEAGNYAIFRLGKKETIKISLPPEEAFGVEKILDWPHTLLFFNFDSDSKTGQKIAIEYKFDVFSTPHIQLSALAEKLNEDLSADGYVISINPVTTENKFWEIVNHNKNNIKSLTLTFNSPNLFNLKGALNTALKDVQKEYSATKSTLVLENPEGKLTIPHSELIKQGVEYISKGGGSYKLKVKTQKTLIKDKDNIETKEVIDLDLDGDKELIKQALDKIFNKDA